MKHFKIDGHALAYRDEGRGPALVFVHGTPSSSAEFVEVVARLRDAYRCIAVDHLGFGESDKPEHADYSIAAHRKRLQAVLSHLGVRDLHLVVHDFGGAIALPLVLDDTYRVRSLTLMNTWLWPLEETEPALRRQRPLLRSRLMRFLYRQLNLSARMLVKASWGTHRPLTRDHHQRYITAFRTPSERSGTIAFLDALLDRDEPAWQLADAVAAAAPRDALLLWGMADRAISANTLSRWQHLLPQASVARLDRVGHFIADEAPELVVDQLRAFLDRSRKAA